MTSLHGFMISGQKHTFTFTYNVSCSFLAGTLYQVKISFYSWFAENFYQKWMLDFVKCFICVYYDDHTVFLFSSITFIFENHLVNFKKKKKDTVLCLVSSNHPCLPRLPTSSPLITEFSGLCLGLVPCAMS